MSDVVARPRTLRLGVVALAAVLATLSVTTTTANAEPLPPPNPSDSQIQQGKNAATAASAEVGRLSGQLSATQAQIQQLHDAMELKSELANKAQVDVQLAEMAAEDAQTAANTAQQDAKDAAGQITEAEEKAADFAAASYRQGATLGSITALLDADSMDEILARQQMIQQVSGNQAAVLGDLTKARTVKANLDSAAKAAVQRAQQAKQAASDAKVTADDAFEAAQQSFTDGWQKVQALQAQVESQLAAYQQALNQVAGLQGQREQYLAWAKAKADEDRRIAAQAQVQQSEADDLAREKRAAEQLANQEASNRLVAISNEKARQAKLKKQRDEQERLEKLRQEREAAGLDPGPEVTVGDGTRGQLVVQAALKYLGTRYSWGGGNANGPTKGIRDYGIADRYGDYKNIGFDCSGLALYAWAQQGVYLPHYSGYQYNYGTRVGKSDLQPGDLVFYAYNTSNPATIHHVAIYMGNNQMVEAPQSGSVVKISPMRWSGYIGAARPGV